MKKVTKAVKVTKPKVKKPQPVIEPTTLPEEPLNEVIITIRLGKSTVTARTTVDLFKQDYLTIWDKALADLDELNAQD